MSGKFSTRQTILGQLQNYFFFYRKRILRTSTFFFCERKRAWMLTFLDHWAYFLHKTENRSNLLTAQHIAQLFETTGQCFMRFFSSEWPFAQIANWEVSFSAKLATPKWNNCAILYCFMLIKQQKKGIKWRDWVILMEIKFFKWCFSDVAIVN